MEEPKTAEKREIQIYFNKEADRIVLNPPLPVEASPGDVIIWKSYPPFSIHFAGLSPLGPAVFRSTHTLEEGSDVAARVSGNAPCGRYAYFLAILTHKGQILTDQAEIVVQPRP